MARPRPLDVAGGNRRLDSWKEIAQFLNRSVRTVQRWERLEQLPVHRLPHAERSSVFAFTAELVSWWEERASRLTETAEPPRAGEGILAVFAGGLKTLLGSWRILAGVAGALTVSFVVTFVIWSKAADPEISPVRAGRILARATSEGGSPARLILPHRPYFLTLAAKGRQLWVSEWNGPRVAFLDAQNLSISGEVLLDGVTKSLVAAPDGSAVYAGTLAHTVHRISTTGTIVRSYPLPGGVSDLAITPDGRRLYAALAYDGLVRVDVETGSVRPLPVVACPMYLAMSPDGSRLYINYQCGGPGGREGEDALEVLDLKTEAPVGTVNGVPSVGFDISLSPRADQLWMTAGDVCHNPRYGFKGCPEPGAGLYHVIRTSNLSLLKTLVRRNTPSAGAPLYFPDGDRVLLAGSDLMVMDARTFKLLEKADIAGARAVFSADGRRLYMTQPSDGALAVFDAAPPGWDPPSQTLASFWPADGSLEDRAGGMVATFSGKAGYAPGIRGQAFRLPSGASVTTGPRNDIFGGTQNGAVSFWVKFQSETGNQPILDRIGADGRSGWRICTDEAGHFLLCQVGARGPDRCDGVAAGGLRSRQPAQNGAWHHVAFSRAGKTIRLYVNGRPEAEAAVDNPHQFMFPETRMTIGGGRPGQGFDGLVDELAIYLRALSEREIRALARGG